jgi:transposase
LFTWFHIDERRSSQVLFDTLGEEFKGVLSCDYFSAYRKYMRECDVLVQFCLAHLIRELRYLRTLPDAPTAAYGRRLVGKVRELFRLIHDGETLARPVLETQLRDASEEIIRSATTRVPGSSEAQAIAKRFRKHGHAYFQFITTPEIEPTNNLAEQALRFVVIDRRITQGTRSEKGQRWCERIWTVLATCAQQGRSAMDFLTQATTAWARGDPPPSLVPQATPT